ncbi:hypothetical protein DFH11DRAFT_1545007 [Phellopilus nigrolimitatus]|nr:hypothetical protein DFH11DRAFT_1545007 [Phellopilus nigrolimitatus]
MCLMHTFTYHYSLDQDQVFLARNSAPVHVALRRLSGHSPERYRRRCVFEKSAGILWCYFSTMLISSPVGHEAEYADGRKENALAAQAARVRKPKDDDMIFARHSAATIQELRPISIGSYLLVFSSFRPVTDGNFVDSRASVTSLPSVPRNLFVPSRFTAAVPALGANKARVIPNTEKENRYKLTVQTLQCHRRFAEGSGSGWLSAEARPWFPGP